MNPNNHPYGNGDSIMHNETLIGNNDYDLPNQALLNDTGMNRVGGLDYRPPSYLDESLLEIEEAKSENEQTVLEKVGELFKEDGQYEEDQNDKTSSKYESESDFIDDQNLHATEGKHPMLQRRQTLAQLFEKSMDKYKNENKSF